MNQKDFNNQFVSIVRQNSLIPENFLDLIKDSPKLSAKRAIEVYQEDYQARLTEALKNTYKATHSLIGDTDFQILANAYISATLSHSLDLDDYGDQLAPFTKKQKLAQDYPFLASLIDFEWNFREVFHKPNLTGLSPEALQNALTKNYKLGFIESVRLLKYPYLILNLYSLKDETEESESMFDYLKPQYLIMYKKEGYVMTRELNESQWHFLEKLSSPLTLSEWMLNPPPSLTTSDIQDIFEMFGKARLIQS